MKLRELKLAEHETAPHDAVLSIDDLQQLLTGAEQLPHTVLPAEAGSMLDQSLALWLNRLSSRQHVVVLTPRRKQEEPVGYILLQQEVDKRWQVLSAWLQPHLRGRGVMTNLYRTLVAAGYSLKSGKILSQGAEAVWKRLGELGLAKVLDTETGEVQEFDESPIGDGSMAVGKDPRFFWVAEGTELLTIYHRGGHEQLSENLDSWLRGDTPLDNINIAAMGSYTVEARE